MRSLLTPVLGILLALTLSGCANNPYKQWYKGADATPEDIARIRANPAPAKPYVEYVSAKNSRARVDEYLRRGFNIMGNSAFSSTTDVPDAGAIQQAVDVKADVLVIIRPEYVGSETSTKVVTTPTVSTSYTSLAAAGKHTPAIAGSATTTTYGTSTNYIPVTELRADFGAVFLLKVKYVFGIKSIALTEEERKARQSNFGVKIDYVIEDTPAYRADLLAGDILEAINGEKITNDSNFQQQLRVLGGQVIHLSVSREGKVIDKSVTLNKFD